MMGGVSQGGVRMMRARNGGARIHRENALVEIKNKREEKEFLLL